MFSKIFGEVSRHVVDSAVGVAAARFASESVDNFDVQELRGTRAVDEVGSWNVIHRTGQCLVLHGPCTQSTMSGNALAFTTALFGTGTQQAAARPEPSPPFYAIVLHIPESPRMFLIGKSISLERLQTVFITYKETIPLLVSIDPSIYDTDKLNKVIRKLRENGGWKAVHVAAALGMVNVLRDPRMATNLADPEESLLRSPLLVAIAEENVLSVTTLLDLCPMESAELTDLKGNTCFHLAAANSTSTIFKLLLDKVPLSQRTLLEKVNNEGSTALFIACAKNNQDIVKILLPACPSCVTVASNSEFPIHLAVRSNSLTIVQELLAVQGPAQLQLKDIKDGGTPLHWATGPELVIHLLEVGSDPNSVNDQGISALHVAARRSCLRSAVALLSHSAFPDLRESEQGDTPLHIAARLCSLEILQALIVFGADVDIPNNEGHSARHLVATSTRSDSSKVLFILSAVGARRCPSDKRNSCTPGCIHNGTDEGIPPENFLAREECVTLVHDALAAMSIRRGASQRSTIEEADRGNGNENFDVGGFDGGRLLCLDGGGIRGIILTQILLVIEKELGVPIVDLFDWIAGTSTGGIVALAIASGKSVAETQSIYLRLKDKVFIGERPYSAHVMEDFLKKEFGCNKRLGDISRPRLMIMTAVVDKRPVDLHVFRNYISPAELLGENTPSESPFLWEAAKVTGAAPSYFRLDHPRFIDGGLIANNPTLDALTELTHLSTALQSLGRSCPLKMPSVILSIGTGIPPNTDATTAHLDIAWPSGILDALTKVPRLAGLINLLVDQATQSEGQVVERGRAWAASLGVPFFRFSPRMSRIIELDETDDSVLVNLLWETRAYALAHSAFIREMKDVLLANAPRLNR